MKKETGGLAFPRTGSFHDEASSDHDSTNQDGMTLRDYFAGMALQGMAIMLLTVKDAIGDFDPNIDAAQATAKGAYEIADAMLAERSK